MTSGQYQEISLDEFNFWKEKLLAKGLQQSYLEKSHQLEFSNSQNWYVRIMLPWSLDFNEQENSLLPIEDYHLALVMIRAGIACAGYFHNGLMLDHKVFRAYMVRKKQGKSQIKYLKTKGKSRAGSRVRLGESELFFNEINERLIEYSDQYPINDWGISCSKTLWPYFFGSSIAPPFDKQQDNLRTIPFHVRQPDFETLQDMHQKLNSYHLLFSESGEEMLADIKYQKQDSEENQDEDW
ncbi:hypothetical protein [Algoriphagus machipongonensis]|uniref:VLRF1 domain-containing protein n=1 Tax=Algoriphagus machipongonensis TaxID=388413 RepID=A3HSV6_9BACT|nr:hypothetical protein [Algoriphagus machipongonensis]EAZ82924.1 hypothetical protein ALPR1_11925 [Algoriphagus machipongonensis]